MGWFAESRFGRFFSAGRTAFNQAYSFIIGNNSTTWIDLGDTKAIFETIPQLQSAVKRKASMAANGVWQVVDPSGSVIEDEQAQEVLRLLRKPNPMQSGSKWLRQNRMQYYVYRNSFIYKNSVFSGALPVTLNNLPPSRMKIHYTGKFYDQTEIGDIITKYEMQTSEGPETYETDNVIMISEVDLEHPLQAINPITYSLKYPLSNIDGSYRSRNILINERGAFGIISSDAKDGEAGRPINGDTQKELSGQWAGKNGEYGNKKGQKRWLLTKANIKFTRISVPVDEMKLFEEVEADYIDILEMLGLNINISPRAKGTTFENLKQGLIMAYNDTIIPEGEELAQALTMFLGMDPSQRRLRLNYDHLAVLQKNKKEKSEVLLNVSRAANQLSSASELTEEQQAIIDEALGR